MTKTKLFTNLISLAFISFFLIIAYGSGENPMENQGNMAALAEIKGEPKISEAIITEANVLYASVQDDGTNRNGYAEYLCQVLKSHNASCNRVKVVKGGSNSDPKADNAYGVLLGESWCK